MPIECPIFDIFEADTTNAAALEEYEKIQNRLSIEKTRTVSATNAWFKMNEAQFVATYTFYSKVDYWVCSALWLSSDRHRRRLGAGDHTRFRVDRRPSWALETSDHLLRHFNHRLSDIRLSDARGIRMTRSSRTWLAGYLTMSD